MQAFRLTLLIVSIVIFCISLTNDGFYIDRPSNPRAWAPGWAELMLGWILVPGGIIAWLANPLLFFGWMLLANKLLAPASTIVTALAICIALSFLLHKEIITSEAGNVSAVTGYGSGYYLWIGSMVVAMLAGLLSSIAYSIDRVRTSRQK